MTKGVGWWMDTSIDCNAFDGAACAKAEHRAEQDIWIYDAKVVGRSEARRMRDRAVGICVEECPVIAYCAGYALRNPDLVGVWGGMDEDDRRKARKRLRAT